MQKKRVLLIGYISIVLTATAYIFSQTILQLNKNEKIAEKNSELPNIQLTNTDGSKTSLKIWGYKNKVLIFYFNSECEHCKKEVQEYKKYMENFKDIKVLWISNEDLKSINMFKLYNFQNIPTNTKIAQISSGDAVNTFGFKTAPSIFIYDENGDIVKKYSGSTKMETILRFI